MADNLNHFTEDGRPQMVDVAEKADTNRIAIAKGTVNMASETLALIAQGSMKKGDVLSVAQLAGIIGAKYTASIIPLCHPISLDHVNVKIIINDDTRSLDITSECRLKGKTGVEMEALTAVSIAALTIYDMCKAIDKTMSISNIRLVHKSGGKSGLFNAN